MTKFSRFIPAKPYRYLACSAALALSPSVLAEIEDNNQGLEEVVVSGEKVDRSLQDTVSSVGVIGIEDIEQAAIFDIQDVFTRMANVNGTQANEGFAIRGINHSTVTGSGGLNTVGLASLYLDGAVISPLGVRAGQAELWDIAQVEVFRGPQSTNLGRNALAGAVVIRSADPTYEWENKYRLYYGERNTRAASLAFGGGIIDDELAFRIAIDDQATDGFIENPLLNSDTYGDSSSRMIRGKLLWEPASLEGLSVLTTLSHSENKAGDPIASKIDANNNAVDPFSRKAYANILGFDNHDQSIATLEVNYDINDVWRFTSVTSGNRSEYKRQDDSDRQASGGLAKRTRATDTDVFSQELRLSFNNDKWQGNIGAYYFNLNQDSIIDDVIIEDVRQRILVLVPRIDPNFASLAPTIADEYDETFYIDRDGGRGSNIENWALFANFDYYVSDFVTLFAGLRYDREEVSNYSQETRTPFNPLPDPASYSNPALGGAIGLVNQEIAKLLDIDDLNDSTDYNAFLPKAGITLNWDEDLSTSFSVQRGYRAGGSGVSASGIYTYDPEYTTNYELALRSQWFDQRLTVNANIFYIDWTDQQVVVADPDDTTRFLTSNAGKSELYGAELELSVLARDNLEVFFNLGYTQTEFTDFPDPLGNLTPEEADKQDFTGHEFIEAPKFGSAAGFVWDLTYQLSWQADIYYRDGGYDNAQNDAKNDDRTVVNSKLAYAVSDNFEVALSVRNLFDEDYITRSDVTSTNVVNVSDPRTIGLQIQGSF